MKKHVPDTMNHTAKTRHCQAGTAGFTLIELLITMAVVSIIAAFSVPRVDRWLKRLKVKDASSDIATDFQKTRSLAENVRTQNTTGGAFNPFTSLVQRPSRAAMLFRDDGYGLLLRRDSNVIGGWSSSNAFDTEVKHNNLPHDVEIVSVENSTDGVTDVGDNPVVSFASSGIPMNDSNTRLGTITTNCGGTADSNAVIAVVLQSEAFDGNRFYYKISIQQSGDYTVCGSTSADFAADGLMMF